MKKDFDELSMKSGEVYSDIVKLPGIDIQEQNLINNALQVLLISSGLAVNMPYVKIPCRLRKDNIWHSV